MVDPNAVCLPQNHLRPVQPRRYHGDAPAGRPAPRSGVSLVTPGHSGVHRHRPGRTDPGSASAGSDSGPRRSVADAAGSDRRGPSGTDNLTFPNLLTFSAPSLNKFQSANL